MIKQIIEKYITTDEYGDDAIRPEDFPALEQDLESEMEKRAVAFADWANKQLWNLIEGNWYNYDFDKCKTGSELYDRFKFEQWAEREGYAKTHMGWTKDEVMFISDSLFSQINRDRQEVWREGFNKAVTDIKAIFK